MNGKLLNIDTARPGKILFHYKKSFEAEVRSAKSIDHMLDAFMRWNKAWATVCRKKRHVKGYGHFKQAVITMERKDLTVNALQFRMMQKYL